MTNEKKRYLIVLICLLLLVSLVSLLLSSTWGANLQAFLEKTHVEWEKPSVFGSFHLCFLAICIILSVLVGFFGCRTGKKYTDAVAFWAGVLFLLMESYKQWYSFFAINGGVYDFGTFPFQFCSLPIYLCLIVPFLGEGREKEALYRFLALYGTMGGCLVMAFPAWYSSFYLCLHTMLWHTLMIVFGVYVLFARRYGRRYFAELLPASAVFLSVTALATLLNLLLYPLSHASPNPLNLFYMSPYHSTYLLLVKDAWNALGWWAGMLVYVLLFVFVGATTVWGVARLIWLVKDRFLLKK